MNFAESPDMLAIERDGARLLGARIANVAFRR